MIVPNMLLASEDIKQKQNERTKSRQASIPHLGLWRAKLPGNARGELKIKMLCNIYVCYDSLLAKASGQSTDGIKGTWETQQNRPEIHYSQRSADKVFVLEQSDSKPVYELRNKMCLTSDFSVLPLCYVLNVSQVFHICDGVPWETRDTWNRDVQECYLLLSHLFLPRK